MAAVDAQAFPASRNTSDKRKVQMAATKIYQGLLVMINSAGFATEALAAVANQGCVGVAMETVDNSAGSAGDLEITIQEGEFEVAATSIAQTSVGLKCYASNGNTVDETQGTNEPVAGILTEVVSATKGWVKVGTTEALL